MPTRAELDAKRAKLAALAKLNMAEKDKADEAFRSNFERLKA